MKNISKTRGFTLIELMVTVTIIAILAAMLVPISSIFREKGGEAAGVASTCCIRAALEKYYLEEGSYPGPIADHNTFANIVTEAGCTLKQDDEIIPVGYPILHSYECRNYAIDTVNGGWVDLVCNSAPYHGYEAVFDLSGLPGKQSTISSIETCKLLDSDV